MSTPEQNIALVREYYAATARRDVDAAISYLSPDWVNHDPNLPPFAGHEGARQLFGMAASTLSDMQFTIEDIFAAGDRVALRADMLCTHTGPFLGVPATGRRVSIPHTAIHRVVDGKITDNWVQFDALGLMMQLGVIPAPGEPVGAAA